MADTAKARGNRPTQAGRLDADRAEPIITITRWNRWCFDEQGYSIGKTCG